jgi:phage gp29-like protein
MADSRIVDQYGRPIQYDKLTEELAAARTTGIRQVWHQSVASGLTPGRLANILQAAAEGSAHDYLTLAEEMEERDLHYASVLGTRKLAISGLSIRVEAASDDAEDVRRADQLKEIVDSPEFGELQADLTDAMGKGYAVSEIMWDRSGKTWNPERFEPRDQRFFQFDRDTGRELRLLDEADPVNGVALAPYKFIVHLPRIRSGLPIRGGLARLAAVGYMCKAWTWKDWMGFADIFGMPMRVGRYGPGASKDDIATLMSAVANLGSDAAAVIPDSMRIDFTQAANVTGAGDFFKGLAEWWDKQVSKAVVGQTMSTDDGSSQAQATIHNEVRLDLLQADAKAESNTLNRYFVRPWCDLNFAPGRPYPRLIIDVPKPENTKILIEALKELVPLGLKVEQSVIRDKLNIPAPAEGAELLGIPAPVATPALAQATNSEQVPAKPVALPDIVDNQVRTMERAVGVHLDDMVEQIKELLDTVNSLEEFRDRLIETYPTMTTAQMTDAIADGLAAASLAGRDDILRGL